MDSSAARICPECAADQATVKPRSPWWCRPTGLPLLILVVYLTLAAAAAALTASDSSSTFGLGMGTFAIKGMTVEKVRAAADGDDAVASRLAHELLTIAAHDKWLTGAARLVVAPLEGIVTQQRTHSFGGPSPYMEVSRSQTTEHAPGPPPDVITATERSSSWMVGRRLALIRKVWTSGNGVASSLLLRPHSFALLLLLFAAAATMVWRVTIASRYRLVIRGIGLLVISLPLFAGFSTVEHSRPSRLPAALQAPPPLLADAHALARTVEGRRELAEAVRDRLAGAPTDRTIVAGWHRPGMLDSRVYSLGWPTPWISTYDRQYQIPVTPDPKYAQREVRWHQGTLQWRRIDETETQWLLSISFNGIAATLMPGLIAAGTLVATGSLLRRKRVRILKQNGRCLSCGYQIAIGTPR